MTTWQWRDSNSQPYDCESCILTTAPSQVYIESMVELMPWFFALDHTNYARWLSVHIRDMLSLSQTHPDVYDSFCAGAFVAHKTHKAFSAMALDQAHEQVNALVKGDGGQLA